MNAETKVIKHKLSVLELAKDLGNVSAAWRRMGEWIEGISPPASRLIQLPLSNFSEHITFSSAQTFLALIRPFSQEFLLLDLFAEQGSYVRALTIA